MPAAAMITIALDIVKRSGRIQFLAVCELAQTYRPSGYGRFRVYWGINERQWNNEAAGSINCA